MSAKKPENMTDDEKVRRARIIEATEKATSELRPLLARHDLPPEKKKELTQFLKGCDVTRLVFEKRPTCSDMPIESFIKDKLLKIHIKEHGVKRLSNLMLIPESRFRTMCREGGFTAPEYLILLHRAYQETSPARTAQQAWFSPLVRG